VLAWLEDVKDCNQRTRLAPGTAGVPSTGSPAGSTDVRLRRAVEQFVEAMSACLRQLTKEGAGEAEEEEEVRRRF